MNLASNSTYSSDPLLVDLLEKEGGGLVIVPITSFVLSGSSVESTVGADPCRPSLARNLWSATRPPFDRLRTREFNRLVDVDSIVQPRGLQSQVVGEWLKSDY